jgi:hypothetical protein
VLIKAGNARDLLEQSVILLQCSRVSSTLAGFMLFIRKFLVSSLD